MIHTDGRPTIAMRESDAVLAPSEPDIASLIFEYEMGELDRDGTLALFQRLVDTGLAWTLQGSYGRAAQALIEAGLIEAR